MLAQRRSYTLAAAALAAVGSDVLDRDDSRAALATVLLVFLIAAGAVYEVYESFSDSNRATHYQPNNADTMTDMTASAVGELAGGVWLAAWSGHPRNHQSRTTTAHPFARENHVR